MNVILQKAAPTEKNILRNLYSFYLHDLSAYSASLKTNSEGTFEFDAFDLIWEKEGLTPYFIKYNEELAGFLLLIEPPLAKRADYSINDFFLFNQYRRKGIGEEALRILWDEKPGSYYIVQLSTNQKAVAFWKKIFQRFSLPFEETLGTEDGEEIVSQIVSAEIIKELK